MRIQSLSAQKPLIEQVRETFKNEEGKKADHNFPSRGTPYKGKAIDVRR